MAVFHQMGHHSNNLIDLPAMSAYRGAIFSPINCTQAEATEQIAEVRASRDRFEILFDPQLYVPETDRGKLKKWAYFPRDFDTADPTDAGWWEALNEKLSLACLRTGVDTVCSPVIIPKVFDDDYYSEAIDVCNALRSKLEGERVGVVQTVLAGLADLTREDRPFEIASIASRTDAERIYLVFVGSDPPRRELNDVSELVGGMRLIKSLEENGLPVTVGFCASDVLLWKAAGASACASGKFFNLRRFTRQRFEEPKEGGGQLPYWFEEALLAFLRQGDLLRIRKIKLVSKASAQNPFATEVLTLLDEASRTGTKPKSWLALSWRQFLFWFADAEGRLADGQTDAETLLKVADTNWRIVDREELLMEERPNDGSWIRAWLNALREFRKSSV